MQSQLGAEGPEGVRGLTLVGLHLVKRQHLISPERGTTQTHRSLAGRRVVLALGVVVLDALVRLVRVVVLLDACWPESPRIAWGGLNAHPGRARREVSSIDVVDGVA